jgi:hypothetical protein
MIYRKIFVSVAFSCCLLTSAAVWGDVFKMGGVRDAATGTWTGLASVEFVPVGDKNNLADPDTGYGSVDHDYNIGKYDVTAGQYCEFLNAVAKNADPYGLYNPNMNIVNYSTGCNIIRNVSAGKYSYSVASDWANRPVNFVSWGDAARFCNWLQNGQKIGNEDDSTTESGAYTLGGAKTDALLVAVSRNVNAQYFIPSLNESYKAAYYDLNKNGSGLWGYWNFPTKHDSSPSNVLDLAGTNNANFYVPSGGPEYTIGGPYYRTSVGAFISSPSIYGTYDQGGNVAQWNETNWGNSARSMYGCSFGSTNTMGKGLWKRGMLPSFEDAGLGFRIGSSVVPEPSIITMLFLGILIGLQWRQQKL